MQQHSLHGGEPDGHETPGLFELFAVILKRKRFILVSMAVVFSLTASLHTLHSILFVREAWVAECAIVPVDTNATVLKNALNNPRLPYAVIEKKALLPALRFAFSAGREAVSASSQELSALQAAQLLQKALHVKITSDQDLLQVGLSLRDPETALGILADYLEELPILLDRDLRKAGARDRVSLAELTKALGRMEQTNDVYQKKDIAHKLTAYLVRDTGLGRTNWIYFDVLEKPSLRKMQGRSLQQVYADLVPLWIFLSAVIAVFLAFFMDARDRRRRHARRNEIIENKADTPAKP